MLRRPASLLLFTILISAAQFAVADGKSLSKDNDRLLSDPQVARGFWGIEIVDVATGKTLYKRNEDKLFTPASNAKLFTTAAALALIGPEYRFRTTVETTGMVDKYGRLNGDLVLVGRGDPNISGRALPIWPNLRRNTHRDLRPEGIRP